MTNPLKVPALFVGEIDDDINFSLPPSTGEEYIKRVVIEARQCSDVVVANIDQKHCRKPIIGIEPLAGCIEPPNHDTPSLEWQQCQVSDFTDIRAYINRLKPNPVRMQDHFRSQFVLPLSDDKKGWVEFFHGTNTCSSEAAVKPTLSLLFCFEEPCVDELLEYIIEHIEETRTIDHRLGCWVYGLLAKLETPLKPDTCSCLRSLARTCSIIRANSKVEGSDLGMLNLFICLVARYFRQLDLAE